MKMNLHKRIAFAAMVFLCGANTLCAGEIKEGDWTPALKELPELSCLSTADTISGKTSLGTFRPADFVEEQSLDGTWKLSKLETSETPFPADATPEEIPFAAEQFDAAGWNDIRVPLNWYRLPQNAYQKIFRQGEKLNPLSTGGAIQRGIINSYVKGWYRRELTLDSIPAGSRVVISFERIGYAAQLFVNGLPAKTRHHGDFISFECDITELLHPGKNTLALRVLSDIRPINGRFAHTYGAMWDINSYKGGIWGHVKLRWLPEPRVKALKLKASAAGVLSIVADVVYSGSRPLRVIPGLSVTSARRGSTPASCEYPEIELQPGENTITLQYREENPKKWSFREPNLYFATLFFRNASKLLSAHSVRFGFRDFEARGNKFYLNGEETYLFFESAHSIHYGGYPSQDGHQYRPLERIGEFKQRGYNMLRTAHMPVPQEILDRADELGMMIYDEWSMAFLTGFDHDNFEINNLPELAKFIAADHNHPSVVMWALGNEVSHKRDKGLVEQLDKQYDLVRELDMQKRPICSFAGLGDLEAYGKSKLKTDVIDLHCYIGMTDSWTLTNLVNHHYYNQLAALYGDGKKLNMPYIVSECVGGGWGYDVNPAFSLTAENYLKIMKRATAGNG